MKTVKVLKSDTNETFPAEVRSINGTKMVVLFKEFETAKMQLMELTKGSDDTWSSGVYSCIFTVEDMGGGEKLVRVPKK